MGGRAFFFRPFPHGGERARLVGPCFDARPRMIELLPAALNRRERWKNGGGWTREIWREPADGEFSLRFSIAEVGSDAPFSDFPGCDRELVLLTGHGMRLVFDDGEDVHLHPPHGRHRFSGERRLHAVLVDGPTTDFNAIWRRDRYAVTCLHRPVAGSFLFFAESGVRWFVHVLSGHIRAGNCGLDPGDSAWIGGEGRAMLEGGGEVLLFRVCAT